MKTLYKKTPKKARKCGMILLVITMKSVGIICEYNPFHNGHIYHIKKIKEKYPNAILVLCLNGYFLERGEISLLSKEDKTCLALSYGVDIVIELPVLYGTVISVAMVFSDLPPM